MLYRNATLDDLPVIVEIYNSTVASRMVTADTEAVSVDSKLRWFQDHSPEKRPLLVIENEREKIIGWLSFQSFYGRPAYDTTAEVSIYITPTERGNGLGKEMLQHAIDISSRLGIKNLLGFIFSHNEPSLKLFKRFGFETWGEFPNVAVLDGLERSLTILGKRVHP